MPCAFFSLFAIKFAPLSTLFVISCTLFGESPKNEKSFYWSSKINCHVSFCQDSSIMHQNIMRSVKLRGVAKNQQNNLSSAAHRGCPYQNRPVLHYNDHTSACRSCCPLPQLPLLPLLPLQDCGEEVSFAIKKS